MRTVQFLFIILILFIAACSPVGKSVERLAEETADTIGCKSSQSYFFNSLTEFPLKSETFPEIEDVESALRTRLRADRDEGTLAGSTAEIEKFVGDYLRLYRLASEAVPRELGLTTPAESVQALMALELGDRTNEAKARLQAEWQSLSLDLKTSAEALAGRCEPSEPTPEDGELPEPAATPLLEYLKTAYSEPVYGSKKTVAVAYQSCEVLDLAPMDSSSPNLEGIKIIGRHDNGIGQIRAIESLSKVQKSHYYIRDQEPPQATCASLKDSPLIYDYGGKPAATTSMASPLNLFKDAGTGGTVLGIDCSGYVFTSYATAGLKLRSDQPLKAVQVFGVNAAMMKEPQNNGLNCLAKKYGDLLPGDIIASSGHVVMVDEAGPDPFGIDPITRSQDCTLAKMSHTRFDFVISQSSPSKNGIGINRMLAADYFATSATMRDGLRAYAVSACLKKFAVNQAPNTTKVSVTRHKNTPECKSTEIALVNQDCLSTCR